MASGSHPGTHVAVCYEPTDHHKTEMSYEPGCTGAPTTVESRGVFRGKIELHGTDGFTTVDTHTARGELQVEPRQTCRLSPSPKVKIKHEIEATESGYEAVSAARGLAGGILPSTGSPTKATVKPPAPFAGIAEFALESPKVASWTGNLSVAIPTLGAIALAGPRFNPLLCDSGGCSEAAPEKRPQVVSGGKFEGNFFSD